MNRDMFRREFRRDRFAGLPRWLQVVGWIGVGCFLLILLCGILLIPMLLLERVDLLLFPLGLALVLAISAHLLVHNPFRRQPFLPPGVATRPWVFKPLWIMFAVSWLMLWKTFAIGVPLLHVAPGASVALLGQSTVEVLLDIARWQGEVVLQMANTSLLLYFGFYYLFSSVGPRTVKPRVAGGAQMRRDTPPPEDPAAV